jgi:hypothetical protein
MGILGRLFGGEQEHLPLDPASTAATRLQRDKTVLEEFAHRVHDKLEFIPGSRATYVFIGKPPDAFGIAWIEYGEEHNFKRLMKDKGLSQREVQVRSDELRQAYIRSKGEPRYRADIGGKHVLVTPSSSLEQELVEIIHRVVE